jgi:glycosyltransferase involved in cell wall biosynthesis
MIMDVSVIIPTYNRLWALPKAVDSCRNTECQTEIIVIDDGSNDGTWEWLQTQPDVISFRQDNWGKDWAVNAAFAKARGEHVRFLDSDDWLLAGSIDKQLGLARKYGADVVVAGFIHYDEMERLIRESPWIECDDFIAQQLGECDSSHYSAYLFRRSFIENIPHRQEFGVRDDRMFIIEVSMRQPVLAVCHQPTLGHRQHSHCRLQAVSGMLEIATNFQHVQLYRKAFAQLAERGLDSRRRRKAACRILWPLAHWIARTNRAEASEVAEWITVLDPTFSPPDAGLLGMFYRRLGFEQTEWLLSLRRALLRCTGR